MAKRRNHAPGFKAKVALEALSGNKTIAELSTEYGVHQTQINRWVKQLKDGATAVFSGECLNTVRKPVGVSANGLLSIMNAVRIAGMGGLTPDMVYGGQLAKAT